MVAALVRAEAEVPVVAGFIDEDRVAGVQHFYVCAHHGFEDAWKQAD